MAVGEPEQLYKLSQSSTLLLTRGDITRFEGDAIVNAGTLHPPPPPPPPRPPGPSKKGPPRPTCFVPGHAGAYLISAIRSK